MHPGWTRRILTAAFSLVPASLAAQAPTRPLSIGMNVPALRYYAATAPFANLIMGSQWQNSLWQPLAEQHQDRDGNLVSLPWDNTALRFLNVPPTGPAGVRVNCTFAGSATLTVSGHATAISSRPNALSFTLRNVAGSDAGAWLTARGARSTDTMRNLDCREATLAPSVRFRPEALATLRGYSVLRFMDWQNANENEPVNWPGRHLPTGNRYDHDGVSIEDMMAMSAELGASPWFVMPWNATDDYISRFAQLVAQRLPRGREVYVEVGNEVWNDGFPVARQAIREGYERRLAWDDQTAKMRRYAQRTVEVMRLWEAAFAGRTGLVRVLATHHVNPDTARTALSYADTASHVDALATAPYFGGMFFGTSYSNDAMIGHLASELTIALDFGEQNRAIATRYGKRFITYEGGQGLVLPAAVPLLRSVQYDKRMYGLYRSYLSQWRSKVGDLMTLLTSVSPTGPSGAWGLTEREDETVGQSPKLRAVRDEMDVAPAASNPIAKLR